MDFSFENVSKALGMTPSKVISTENQARDVPRHQYNTRSSTSSVLRNRKTVHESKHESSHDEGTKETKSTDLGRIELMLTDFMQNVNSGFNSMREDVTALNFGFNSMREEVTAVAQRLTKLELSRSSRHSRRQSSNHSSDKVQPPKESSTTGESTYKEEDRSSELLPEDQSQTNLANIQQSSNSGVEQAKVSLISVPSLQLSRNQCLSQTTKGLLPQLTITEGLQPRLEPIHITKPMVLLSFVSAEYVLIKVIVVGSIIPIPPWPPPSCD